jgi:hypothetical protein
MAGKEDREGAEEKPAGTTLPFPEFVQPPLFIFGRTKRQDPILIRCGPAMGVSTANSGLTASLGDADNPGFGKPGAPATCPRIVATVEAKRFAHK